jgi:hemerythrin
MSNTISELQTVGLTDEDQSRTGLLLRKLADFSLTHFALEEAMMAATKYPQFAQHRLNHQRMIEQMQAFTSSCKLGRITLNRNSLSFLSDLHTTHVQSDDMHYGLWLNVIGKP